MQLRHNYANLLSLGAPRNQVLPRLQLVSSTAGLTCLITRSCKPDHSKRRRQRVRAADEFDLHSSIDHGLQRQHQQSVPADTATASSYQQDPLPAEQPPQPSALLQQHHSWSFNIGISRFVGSVLAVALLGLALPGRRSAAAAATLPPPWTNTTIHATNSSSSSSSSHGLGPQILEDSVLGDLVPASSSTSSSNAATVNSSSSSSPSGWHSNTVSAESPYTTSSSVNQPSSSITGSSPADQSSSSSSSSSSSAAAELDDLLAYERATVNLFAAARPSVVNITHLRAMQNFYTLDIHRMAVGQGSGFIWDKYGHVITNYHVIKGAAEVKVTLFDHSSCTARVVGYDVSKDIAVLKLALPRGRLEALPPVTLGSSASLKIGQAVFAIGNPFGLDHTLTQGIVSGLGREVSAGLSAIKGVIQTDAAINPGNSGGVLLNSKGAVTGVSLGILDPSGKGSFSGVGFAVPIDTVKGLVDQILQFGRVRRPSLGITIAPEQVLAQLGTEGVLVLEVPAGTPAAAAGLRATYRDVFGDIVLGDVIVGLDTRPIRSAADLVAALDERRPGDKVRCDVLRDGKRLSMTVTLGERGGYCE